MIPIEGAIFDLDGTLLDSMHVWEQLGENYLKSVNRVPPENIREILKPMSIIQAAKYLKREYQLPFSEKEIILQINEMVEKYYKETLQLKKGVLALLKSFLAHKVPMCIATATDRYLVEAALKRLHISHYFEKIFTCTEVGDGKDQPTIYVTAQNFLGTKRKNTLVFEDALYAIVTAQKAGFPVAAIEDATAEKDAPEIKRLADIYITSYIDWRNEYENSIDHSWIRL